MASRRNNFRSRQINPTYYVFCEGQTEEAYINLLKSHYRLPTIIIRPKVVGSSISNEEIENYKNGKVSHEKDLTFLLYDGDVESVVLRLNQINGSIKLISNPCIELWFLLHLKNCTSFARNQDCIRELVNRVQYSKGKISDRLKEKLTTKIKDAISRAKSLSQGNPSTTVYELLEYLERLKK